MKATPWQEVVRQTAEQLNLPEELVKKLVLTYWKECRKEMGDLKKIKVRMMGLGTFVLMPWRVERQIDRIKKRIKKITKGKRIESLKKYLVVVELRKELKQVRAINNFLKKEMKRHQKIRVKQEKMRKEYYPVYLQKLEQRKNDELNKNLESQKSDTGGDQELYFQERACGGDSGGAQSDM